MLYPINVTAPSKKQHKIFTVLLVLVLLVVAALIIKDVQRSGDFIGYLTAGNSVLTGSDIYLDYLNTWPPFFSIVCVPLTLLNTISPVLARFIWLSGSWIALFYCFKLGLSFFTRKTLRMPFQKARNEHDIVFTHPIIMLPLLFCLRFFMDNNSHLQINVYMLLLALGSVYFYHKNKVVLAACLLAFSIAIKVFTIFILLYFIYKRAYRMSLLTLLLVAAFCASTALVFGLTEAIDYHALWFTKSVVPLPPTSNMNQSLLATLTRYLSDVPTGIDLSVNILDLAPSLVKRIYYGCVALAALYPMYLFKKRLKPNSFNVKQLLQWSILFSVVPILSPVAWKPYFVFLWFPFLVFYALVFYANNPYKNLKLMKTLFYLSLVCLILSTELFTGIYFSDVLEIYGVITLGTLLFIGAQFVLYFSLDTDVGEENVESLTGAGTVEG